MQIIIPMTGNGSRFKSAGYSRLKPFIEVHDTPIIEWVTRMFAAPDTKLTFVCRQEHLDTLDYYMETLDRIAPDARILGISDWEKRGPVYDILRKADDFDDDAPTLISYCDYYMQWDLPAFVLEAKARNCDGAVPCYTGFHPHLIPSKNVYASCKVDENDNLIEIREKYSWTEDKTKSRHSPGAYYFRTGALMKKYYQQMVESDLAINGEYYSSLPYNFMVQDGLDVWCPTNVTKFCQWGTPEDLEEYTYWVDTVRKAKLGAIL